MDMDVTDLGNNTVKIALHGRLDTPGVDQIELRFSATIVPKGKNAIVDLSDVSFVASMGLRMFISVARSVAGKDGKLVLLTDTYLASAKSLQASNPTLAGTRAQKAGDMYLRMGDKPDKALEAAQMAATLNPGSASTQKLLTSAKTAAADRYYRSGLSAFRKQELDAAIKSWDKVLEIDPDHENAKLQRAQAIELKEKLSKLR